MKKAISVLAAGACVCSAIVVSGCGGGGSSAGGGTSSGTTAGATGGGGTSGSTPDQYGGVGTGPTVASLLKGANDPALRADNQSAALGSHGSTSWSGSYWIEDPLNGILESGTVQLSFGDQNIVPEWWNSGNTATWWLNIPNGINVVNGTFTPSGAQSVSIKGLFSTTFGKDSTGQANPDQLAQWQYGTSSTQTRSSSYWFDISGHYFDNGKDHIIVTLGILPVKPLDPQHPEGDYVIVDLRKQ